MASLKKIFLKIIQGKIKNPVIGMTLLVKNEVDVIEENLLFHKSVGVDFFVVTDNGSTDGTLDILKKYKESGLIKELIIEESQVYQQDLWVDRMIKVIKNKYYADWIINCDADEFWVPQNMDLKKTLEEKRENVLEYRHFNVIPENESNIFSNTKIVNRKVKDVDSYNLSEHSIYSKTIKVIHRLKGYEMIGEGNHKVKIKNIVKSRFEDIKIFHYGIRSEKQFVRKMENGYITVKNNVEYGKKIAVHWRYFGKICEQGKKAIKEEYRRVIGIEYIDEFLKNGIIIKDNSVKKRIEDIKKG